MRLRHCLLILVSVLGLLMLSPATGVYGGQISNIDEALNIKDEPGDALKPNVEKHGAEKSVEAVAPMPLPTPLQLARASRKYESAYKDTYNILSENNSCSSFYGGPHVAVMVFNQLVGQLRTGYDGDSNVGISMSTPVTNIDDQRTGYSYRLFASAKLNSNGPFYKNRVPVTDKWIPHIGDFQANTRGARSLMLLHELGHLMKGPDQQWLLQDDGGDPLLSFKNTKIVEAHCAKQLRDLSEGVAAEKFLAAKKSFKRAAESTSTIHAGNDEHAAH